MENNFNGCGDNSCYVVKSKGMGTNVGCRCHKDEKTAKQAIIYLARKVERLEKDNWINLNDSKPEMNEPVIVCTNSGDVDVRSLGICDDDIDPNGLWYSGYDEPYNFNKVILWQPLPESPLK